MQLTLNDSVLSLTSGDHGSKIWTCMLGLHSCHSNHYQLIHKAKKERKVITYLHVRLANPVQPESSKPLQVSIFP